MADDDNENKNNIMMNNNMMNNYLPNVQNIPNIVNNHNQTAAMNYKQNIPLQQNYNRGIYNNINSFNNINNNLINQNSINIINNNIDYTNTKYKSSPRSYMSNNNNINLNKQTSKKITCTCSKTGCKKKYCACFSKGIPCIDCECKDCENKPQIEENNNNNKSNNNNILVKQESQEKDINYSKTDITNSKNQRVICNCTKSNCMKKYCECFKQGLNCNSLCRCIECKNKNYNYDSNNFYNYDLKNNNINISNNTSQVQDYSISHIPETFGKSIDYNNPINFQSEAFGIFIKKEKLKIEMRKISLSLNNKKDNTNINNNNNNENNNNDKEVINNNNDLNETPKFSNKKRLRAKIDNSAGVKTCPTTNSSNRRKRGVSVINKNIKKKSLQLY